MFFFDKTDYIHVWYLYKSELETMDKWTKSTFSSSKNDNIFHLLIKLSFQVKIVNLLKKRL